jgi:hypothetical protein
MNKPNKQQPHSKNTLEALAAARIAALVENHWVLVTQGDIAALRREGMYEQYIFSSHATHMHRDGRGNITDLRFDIWRRLRTLTPIPILEAASADCHSTRGLAEEALDEATDQRARDAEGEQS